MNIFDYIDHQTKGGIFSQSSPFPENDPRVLKEFYTRLKNEGANVDAIEVIVLADRYGFYLNDLDTDREGWNVAGSSSLIDINIGIDYAGFVADLPKLREQASKPIFTDSFSFKDGYGSSTEQHESLVWLNSPVATLDQAFEPYLESLTSERRKKYRRSVADFEKTNLRFEMSDRGLTSQELDFVKTNLEKKWAEEAGYAFRQTLWADVVQKIRPEQFLMMRVYDADKLVFVQTMIIKGASVYCQSITKDEGSFYNGLAAFTDFECIKALCGKSPYAIFDPSCRTSLDDPESIGIAKRATVNKNCVKPILAIGKNFSPEMTAMVESKVVQGKEA